MMIIHFISMAPRTWRAVADQLERDTTPGDLSVSIRWNVDQAATLPELTIGVTSDEAVLIKAAAQRLRLELSA